jgi:hypothetical protein
MNHRAGGSPWCSTRAPLGWEVLVRQFVEVLWAYLVLTPAQRVPRKSCQPPASSCTGVMWWRVP